MKRIALLALVLVSLVAIGQKKPLDHDVYDQWPSIRSSALSADGHWALWVQGPSVGDSDLVIKSLDDDNRHVILAMTFSKPLAPGLKTGYGILPGGVAGPLLRFKGNHDFGSCNLTQHLIDRLLDNGAYDRHVGRLCEVYRGKRDCL